MEDAHLKCLANPIICPICRLRFANGEELAQAGFCFLRWTLHGPQPSPI